MTAQTIGMTSGKPYSLQGVKMESDKFQEMITLVKRMSHAQMARLEREICKHKSTPSSPLLSEEELNTIRSLFSSER
ncbi:hypothetical protein RCJ22_26460 [Vibrio sp. FNV 38]|nr:hypothetical protein [Vibrio sp. FNV 38]